MKINDIFVNTFESPPDIKYNHFGYRKEIQQVFIFICFDYKYSPPTNQTTNQPTPTQII